MTGDSAASDWALWLFQWQTFVGSSLTAAIGGVAAYFAYRAYCAASQQAAAAAAQALRDHLKEISGFLAAVDRAQEGYRAVAQSGREIPKVKKEEANALAASLESERFKMNDARYALAQRGATNQSPAQAAFDRALEQAFSAAGTATLQLQVMADGRPQPLDECLPRFPAQTADAIERLSEAVAGKGLELREELREEIEETRRRISQAMVRATRG